MKRVCLWLLTAWTVLSLCACGKPALYDVQLDEETFTLDTQEQTITHEGDVFQYEIREYSTGAYITGVYIDITYPDGASYGWTRVGSIGYGGWTNGKVSSHPMDADTLLDVLEEETSVRKQDESGELRVLGILCLLVGPFCLFAPRAAWWLEHGWWIKDGEPSDFALAVTKLSGIVAILIGVFCLIYPIFT